MLEQMRAGFGVQSHTIESPLAVEGESLDVISQLALLRQMFPGTSEPSDDGKRIGGAHRGRARARGGIPSAPSQPAKLHPPRHVPQKPHSSSQQQCPQKESPKVAASYRCDRVRLE